MDRTPIVKAIQAAGSVKRLAEIAGVKPQAISQWRAIPPGRCAAIERETGIPRHQLRPDLWEPPASAEAA